MTTLLLVLSTALQIVLIAALADFVAGAIHWLEDAYFSADTPIVGPLFIQPNIVHHHLPRYFTRKTWWESSRDLALAGAVLLLVAWPLGLLCWQLWLFVALGINANEIHKWSHRSRQENGRIISAFQDWHILQTVRHHALHHTDPKNTYYCPITNFVNPVLEKIRFWNRLESIIERLTGIKHREDTAVRGHGPAPEWLNAYRRPSGQLQTSTAVIPFPSGPAEHSHLAAKKPCSTCPNQNTAACSHHSLRSKTVPAGRGVSLDSVPTRLAA